MEVHMGFFFLFGSRFRPKKGAKSTCIEIVAIQRKMRFFLLFSIIIHIFAT